MYKYVILLLLVSTLDLYSSDVGFFKRVFGKLSWEQVCSEVKNPRNASLLVRRNVKYREDLDDIWETGKNTWERGFGDCEDMAQSVLELCHTNNIKASIMIMVPDTGFEAHAIVIGTTESGHWYSSNGWYGETKSIEEAVKEISKQIGWRRKTVNLISKSEFFYKSNLLLAKK